MAPAKCMPLCSIDPGGSPAVHGGDRNAAYGSCVGMCMVLLPTLNDGSAPLIVRTDTADRVVRCVVYIKKE